MQNLPEAQRVLLKGWRSNKDAFNCLNNYLSNVEDSKQALHEMQEVYKNDLNQHNNGVFLRVLEYEYDRRQEVSEEIKDMAYELISDQANINPSIVSELRMFNNEDKQLVKDALRFKMNQQKKS